jgi:hypothetical protein
MRALKVRFAPDSLLEGDGFELSVPGHETVKPSWEMGLLSRKRKADLLGNRRFESISLHRRVMCEPDSSIRAPNIFHRSPDERVWTERLCPLRQDEDHEFAIESIDNATGDVAIRLSPSCWSRR